MPPIGPRQAPAAARHETAPAALNRRGPAPLSRSGPGAGSSLYPPAHECPQLLPGVEQSAHDGANRDPQHFRDLAIIQLAIDMKHKGTPLCFRQRGERLLKETAEFLALQTL